MAQTRYRGVLRGALLLFGLIATAGFGFLFWQAVAIRQTDARYAAEVFDGVLPYDRVIASRRYHTTLFRGRGFGCTYAVVALSADAPVDPPGYSRGGEGITAFGRDWQPGPVDTLVDPPGDAPWRLCEIALGEALWGEIAEAAAAPGGWVAPTAVNGIAIYSPDAGLAALVRVGD